MTEEEEDVILKNSHLYQYLKETECSEIINYFEEEDVNIIEAKTCVPEPKISYFESAKSFFVSILCPSQELKSLYDEYRGNLVHQSMKSKLMCDDDVNFLSTYLDAVVYKPTSSKSSFFAFSRNIILLSLLPIGIWYKLRRQTSNFLAVPILLTGIFCSVINAYRASVLQRTSKNLNLSTRIMENVIRSSTEVANHLKKSIRLIQESEIIARGFAIATVKDAIMRIENNDDTPSSCYGDQFHQCLPLRKQVFNCSNNLFIQTRQLTQDSIKSTPLSDDIDNSSNYLAFVPLDQFHLKDISHCSSDTEENRAYLVYNLKLVVERYYLQQSELISRIILVQFPEFVFNEDCNASHLDVIQNNTRGATNVMEKVLEMNNKAHQILQKSYHFHQCLLDGSNDSNLCILTSEYKEENKVKTSIHSIYLHLQAALARVREFETLLDNMESKDGGKSDDEITVMLNRVMNELRNCYDCVEEGFHLMNTDTSSIQLSKQTPEQPAPIVMDNKVVHPWNDSTSEIGDPRIEQEVFEGVVERFEEFNKYNNNELTEEINKKKHEMEHAVKLYRELKNVLKVRAHDVQERENDLLSQLKQNVEEESSRELNKDESTNYGRRMSSPNTSQNKSSHSPPSNHSFTANIAALAAAKSQSFGLKTLVMEEFNDDDDDCIGEQKS